MTEDELDVTWQADALCAQTDPELFFPEKGDPGRAAKAVCAACLVRAECLDYALDSGERYGIYGGMGEVARRRLLTLDDDDTQMDAA